MSNFENSSEALPIDLEQTAVLAGSIAVGRDESLWYTAGEWGSTANELPAILGYVPSDIVPTDYPYQKTIELSGVDYKKAFGLPLEQYHQYIELVGESSDVEPEQLLGRLALVDRQHLTVWRDPKEHLPRFLDHLPRVRKALDELSDKIEVDVEHMGVSGSSLMFDPPVLRHEIDLGIYGAEHAQRASENMRALIERGDALPVDEYFQRFNFKGIEFDPQFFLNRSERHHLQGLEILNEEIDGPTTVHMEDTANGIFCPAVFGTNSLPLISFRPGQRGLFAPGQTVEFPHLSRLTIRTEDEGEQEVYAVLDEQKGEVI